MERGGPEAVEQGPDETHATAPRHAPDATHAAAPRRAGHEEEMPRVILTRRQIVAFSVFMLSGVGFLYFVLPNLAGVGKTLDKIEGGDVWWLAAGMVLEG